MKPMRPCMMASRREFRAIFFDLDGTLVDIHGPLFIAARKAIGQLGGHPELTREAFAGAMARNDLWMGIPEAMRGGYAKLAFAYLMTEADNAERLEVLPHVPETLAELKRRGYVTGVITSRPGNPRPLVEKLAMVGLAHYLDHVSTQATLSLKALDKSESLKETATRAGIAPDDCMYVGDEPRDIMAAGNAGFGAAIAVATGAASYDHLRAHPQYKPHHVMRSMSELLDLLEWFRENGTI
ncbi:MAG: HAD family hydrolase [Candidatus Binataceae bacterium]